MKKFVICIGVPRTATSFLYQLFRDCSDFSYTPVKETNFFLSTNSETIEEYLKHFEIRSDNFFECSPAYFSSQDALKKISFTLSEPEIIFCTRDIKQRFISQYKHHIKTISKYFSSFEDYCENATTFSNDWFHPNYNYRASNYKRIYQDLLGIFPLDKIHHLSHDDLVSNKESWIMKIEEIAKCSFEGWDKKSKTNQSKDIKDDLIIPSKLAKVLENHQDEFLDFV
jgi:hypothetical protein